MPTLFEIGQDLLAWNDLVEEAGGELADPAAEAAIVEWFGRLADDEARKLDGYVGLIRTLEGEAAVARAEAEQFAARAKARENRAAWLKGRLLQHLQATGRAKAATAAGRTLAVAGNGGAFPLVIDPVDPTSEAVDYRFRKVSLDPLAVRAALEAGEAVPFARLLPRGVHLRIR